MKNSLQCTVDGITREELKKEEEKVENYRVLLQQRRAFLLRKGYDQTGPRCKTTEFLDIPIIPLQKKPSKANRTLLAAILPSEHNYRRGKDDGISMNQSRVYNFRRVGEIPLFEIANKFCQEVARCFDFTACGPQKPFLLFIAQPIYHRILQGISSM